MVCVVITLACFQQVLSLQHGPGQMYARHKSRCVWRCTSCAQDGEEVVSCFAGLIMATHCVSAGHPKSLNWVSFMAIAGGGAECFDLFKLLQRLLQVKWPWQEKKQGDVSWRLAPSWVVAVS